MAMKTIQKLSDLPKNYSTIFLCIDVSAGLAYMPSYFMDNFFKAVETLSARGKWIEIIMWSAGVDGRLSLPNLSGKDGKALASKIRASVLVDSDPWGSAVLGKLAEFAENGGNPARMLRFVFERGMHLAGGGGTILAPVLHHLKKEMGPSDIAMVLTDGYYYDQDDVDRESAPRMYQMLFDTARSRSAVPDPTSDWSRADTRDPFV